jgi:tetratricopeptide (TPR) repeat protein
MMEQTEEVSLHTNEDSYDRLIGVIEASQGMLNLLIVSCEQSSFQTQIIEQYETELSSQYSCYRVKLDPEEPSVRSSLAQLVQEQPELQQSQVAAMVTVTGIVELLTIKLRENEDKSPLDKFFGYLQWTREGLRAFPFPIVLWVTPDILSRMSLAAPDFWSWRGGVFRFSAPAMEIKKIVNTEFQEDLPHLHFEHSNILPLDELEERISQIQTQEAQSPSLATLYDRLGQAYHERISLGKSKNLQADIDLAIAAFQKAIALQQNLGLKLDKGDSLIRLGNLYSDLGIYKSSEQTYQKALEIFRDVKDQQSEASVLGNLGNIYSAYGKYYKAINFYQKSLEIARQIGYKEQETNALGGLGQAYNSLGDYQQAINFYEKSLEIARQIGYKKSEASSLNNLGVTYFSLGEYQQAIAFSQKALALKRELGDKQGEGISLGNLGCISGSLGMYKNAIIFCQKWLDISEEIGDKNNQAKALFNLGLAFKCLQQTTDSLDAFRKARQLFKDTELKHLEHQCDNEINSLTSLSTA